VHGVAAEESIRFASAVVEDPENAVSRWKTVSGWRAAACPAGFSAREILHSVELLPVVAGAGEETFAAHLPCDAWILDPGAGFTAPGGGNAGPIYRFAERVPANMEEALDRIEGLAEWAESFTGRRCTEGALERSLRAYRERDIWGRALAERCAADRGFLAPVAARNVVRAGDFLPVEAHTILLARIVGVDVRPAVPPVTVEDPFLLLALRLRRDA
jgi:hypothetical protein